MEVTSRVVPQCNMVTLLWSASIRPATHRRQYWGRLGVMTPDFWMGVVGIALQSLQAKDGMFNDVCNVNLPTANHK